MFKKETYSILFSSIVFLSIFLNPAHAQIGLTGSYIQDFNAYAGSLATVPTGWTAIWNVASSGGFKGTLTSPDCATTAGGLYALGTSPDYSFGCLYSNNAGNDTVVVNFTNNTGSNINRLNIDWDYRQYGQCNINGFICSGIGALGADVTLANQTFIGSLTATTGSSTHISVVLTGLSIAPSASFGIKWITTIGNGGFTRSGVAIDNFSISSSADSYLYWNGANPQPVGTPNLTANGGSGNWGIAGSWVSPSNPGSATTWQDGNVQANFNGTAGIVTIDNNYSFLNSTFNTSGYTISSASAGPYNLSGSIILGNNVVLNLNPYANSGLPASGRIGIGSVSGTGSASLNIQTIKNATPIASRIDLSSGAIINVPTTITSLGGSGDSALAGYVAANANGVIINGNIVNNSGVTTMIGSSSNGDVNVNGIISGTSGLQFSAGVSGGKGTLFLNAANSYSGATIFNSAQSNSTIKMGIANAIPSNSDVIMGASLSNGGVWDLNGFNQNIASLTNGIGGGYIINNSTTNDAVLTIGGSKSPAAFSLPINDGTTKKISLVRSGTGTTILSGTNGYTGSTTVSGGVLSISSDNNIGASPASVTTDKIILSGGRFALTSSFNLNSNRGITLSGTLDTIDIATGQTSTYSGIIAGSGNITKSGFGNFILSGFNTYTGNTTIASGTLTVSADTAFGAPPATATAGKINLNGGVLATTSSFAINSNRGINLLNSSTDTIDVLSATTLTYGGNMTGSVSNLYKNGSGTLILNGSNDYNGTTTINGGTLQLIRSGGSTLSNATNDFIVSSGSTLRISSSQTLRNITINAGGILLIDNGATLTVNGNCNNIGGTVTVDINSFMAISSNAIFTLNSGTTNLNTSATLTFNGGGSLYSVSSGTTNISGAALMIFNSGSTFSNTSGTTNIFNSGIVTFNTGATYTSTGGSFIIADGGALNIKGTWTSTNGGTIDNNGKITMGPTTSLPGQVFPGTNAVISNMDTLIVNTTNTYGGVTLNKDISNLNGLLQIANSCTLDASTYTLAGTGGLTMGSGFLRLAKNNVVLPELTGAYNLPAGTGGTIIFYGNGTQTLRSGSSRVNGTDKGYDFNNFLDSSTTPHTIIFPANDSIGIKGNFKPHKTNSNFSIGSGNTVIFKGGSQPIPELNTPYNSIVLSGTGTKTVDSASAYSSLAGVSILDSIRISTGIILAMYSGTKPRYITLKSSATKTARVATVAGSIAYGAGATAGPYGFIMERYIPAKRAWRLITAPLKDTTLATPPYSPPSISTCWQEGQTTSGSSPSTTTPGLGTIITNGTSIANGYDAGVTTFPSLKFYDSASNLWTAPPSTTSTSITSHQGYMVFMKGDRSVPVTSTTPQATVLRSRGVIATGRRRALFTYSNNASDTKFRVVGNPYPSAINFHTTLKSVAIGDKYYMWDPQLGGVNGFGAYVTFLWNSTNGNYDRTLTSASGFAGSLSNNGTIESGSAFFVQIGNTTDSIIFNETDKVNTSSSSPFGKPTNSTTTLCKQIRTNLISINPDGTSYPSDGTLITYDHRNNNLVDANDALKFGASSEGLSVNNQNQLLAIERRSDLTVRDTIFFSINQMKQRNYLLEFIPDNISSNLQGYLIDSYTNQTTPVSLIDTTRIAFSVNSDAASYSSNRFMVVFKTSRSLPVTFVSIKAKKGDSNIQLNWNVENEYNINKYIIEHSYDGLNFDSLSQTSPKGNNMSAEQYEFYDVKSSSNLVNYYRIKAVNQDQTYCFSSIAKLVANKNNNQLFIYPNPSLNGIVNINLNNLNKGKYWIKLINNLGQVCYSQQLNINADHESKIITIKNIQKGLYVVEFIDERNKKVVQKINSL